MTPPPIRGSPDEPEAELGAGEDACRARGSSWTRTKLFELAIRSGLKVLAPDQSAEEMLVSLTFASWNQIAAWLRQLDRMRATG